MNILTLRVPSRAEEYGYGSPISQSRKKAGASLFPDIKPVCARVKVSRETTFYQEVLTCTVCETSLCIAEIRESGS